MMNRTPVYTLSQLAEFAQTGGLQWKTFDKKRSTSGSSKSGYKLTYKGSPFAVQLGVNRGEDAQQYQVLNDPGASKKNPASKMWSVLIKIADVDVAAAKVLREWFYTSIQAESIFGDGVSLDAVKSKFRSPFMFSTDVDASSALPKQDSVWVRWKVNGSSDPTLFQSHSVDADGKVTYALYDHLRVQRNNHVALVCTFWPLEEYDGAWSANFVAERVTLDSAECNYDEVFVPTPRAATGGAFRQPLYLPWFNNNVEGYFAFGGTDELQPTWVEADVARYAKPLTIAETAAGIKDKRVKVSDVKFTKDDGTAVMKHYINYEDRKGSMTTALGDLRRLPDEQAFVSFPPTKYVSKVGGGSGGPTAVEDEAKSMSMLLSFPNTTDIADLRDMSEAAKLMLVEHFDSPALAREMIQKRNPTKSAEFIDERVEAHIKDKKKMIKLPTSDPEDMMADYTAARPVIQKDDGTYVYEATSDKPEKVVHYSASLRVSPDNSTDRRITRVFQLNAKNEPFSATLVSTEASLTRGRSLVPVVEWRDINQKDKISRTPWFTTYAFLTPNQRASTSWEFIGEDS